MVLLPACKSGQLPEVAFTSSLGTIIAEIDTIHAPVTAGNFLMLVDSGVYRGACFYRVVRENNQPFNKIRIEVIQGGLLNDSLIETFPGIFHESTKITGIRHLNGTISMARNEPGTASTEFFICIGDQPDLDYGGRRNPDGEGFAAFGRVTEGMDVVKAIQQLQDTSQFLLRPVPVSVSRIR